MNGFPLIKLWCEGDEQSLDAPILRALFGELAQVIPVGSKSCFPKNLAASPSYAIKDGDFPLDPLTWHPGSNLLIWKEEGRHLGWIWARKELENYFVDPQILQKTFSWSDQKLASYQILLSEVLQLCAERTAARMALVGLLPEFERNVVKPLGPDLQGEAILKTLEARYKKSTQKQNYTLDELLNRYVRFLPCCLPGGNCHHPWAFSGKDLIGAFARIRGVRSSFPELIHRRQLGESILTAIKANKSCYTWISEWEELREALQNCAKSTT